MSNPPEPQPSKPLDQVTATDVVQLVVHGAMVPWLSKLLEDRGFRLVAWPHEEDELDTYMVTPEPHLMQQVQSHLQQVQNP